MSYFFTLYRVYCILCIYLSFKVYVYSFYAPLHSLKFLEFLVSTGFFVFPWLTRMTCIPCISCIPCFICISIFPYIFCIIPIHSIQFTFKLLCTPCTLSYFLCGTFYLLISYTTPHYAFNFVPKLYYLCDPCISLVSLAKFFS